MSKSPDAFRTISEVADWLGVQAHVLRFWESKFSQVKPVKRAGGRRYYRPADMQLLGGIKKLLHDDGLTIKGVQKILREQGVAHVSSLSHPLESDPGADVDSTVVRFKSRSDAETPEAAAAAPAPAEAPPGSAAEPEPEPEPAFASQPEPAPAAEAPAAAMNPQDSTRLPAFLHRPRSEPEPGEAPESLPGEAPARRARVVDAPDPPAESELAPAAGLLSRLSQLDRLTAEQAREIAPLAQELRAWLARSAGARPS